MNPSANETEAAATFVENLEPNNKGYTDYFKFSKVYIICSISCQDISYAIKHKL